VAAEGAAATLGTTEDTGGGRQGAVAARGGGRREHGGRQDGRQFASQRTSVWNHGSHRFARNRTKPILLTT
jgi:hypothetical protein